jgi:hypothetical protein
LDCLCVGFVHSLSDFPTDLGRSLFAVAVGYLGLSGRLVVVVMHCCVTTPSPVEVGSILGVVRFDRTQD